MSEKKLMKGNDALAESAVRAGCRYYFGYPITPQNEVPAYMSKRLPEVKGVFVQAESEVASISMVLGAGACGARVMTSSSSPGISLMQEGLSYIAGSEVPAVVANMMRGGPGLGNIAPSQADYLQAVKGGGHGDYKLIVIAPASVQEIIDITYISFDLAIKYRNPVMILGDGILGQMSEPIVLPAMKEVKENYDWALGNGKKRVIIRSLNLNPDILEKLNWDLQEKYRKIKNEYVQYEKYLLDDAEYMVVAYGTTSRVVRLAVKKLREKNIKIGMFRPISLWPFPEKEMQQSLNKVKKVFVFEMAFDQLEQDVKLVVNGKCEVKGFYKLGGNVFNEKEMFDLLTKAI